jgi:hypothetical protein
MSYTFRNYAGPEDAPRQYDLWIRATEDLPLAWRSNVTNVRYQLSHAEEHPGMRIYAESSDGEMRGYIGTHPPFEWYAGGWTMPFGFPWTYPADPDLEVALYDRMIDAAPGLFPGMKRNLYVQRFRESWRRHIDFLLERGWKHKWRFPILGRQVSEITTGRPADAQATREDDLYAVCDAIAEDPLSLDRPDADTLRRRLDDGWLEWEHTWLVPDVGVFALEARKTWANVQLFHPRGDDDAFDTLLATTAATARNLGADLIHFTLEPDKEGERMAALVDQGFAEIDAGSYLVYEV